MNFPLQSGHTYRAIVWCSWSAADAASKLRDSLALLSIGGAKVWTRNADLPADWPADRTLDTAPPPAVTCWVEFVWPGPDVAIDASSPGVDTRWKIAQIWDRASEVQVPPQPVLRDRLQGKAWIAALAAGGLGLGVVGAGLVLR